MSINLPHNFTPRSYQRPLLAAMCDFEHPDRIKRRAFTVWHRRAGKDKVWLNIMINKMSARKGQYYYYFPTMSQGRKILWDGIDRDGFRYMDHFPASYIANKNNQEMKITTKNGSIFQIVGTDRLEVVGPNPVGVVFSEFSLQNPRGWDYVRPILVENKGWAGFNCTPRGRNHAYRLFNKALVSDDWFCECLTVDDTKAVSLDAIEAERKAGMSEALIRQEFYCSWDYGQLGAYWAAALGKLRSLKPPQIGKVPFDSNYCVHTSWDVGATTCVWFFQVVGRNRYYIRYYEDIGQGIDFYCNYLEKLREEQGYYYGTHFGPWDIDNPAHKATEGQTIREVAAEHGIDFTSLPMDKDVNNSIVHVNNNLPLCWFDEENCEAGIDAIEQFHEKQNERMSIENRPYLIGTPEKDWSEHCAKAFIISDQGIPFVGDSRGSISREQIQKWNRKYGLAG